MAGKDRTGEVFAGYKMNINRWTYKRALDYNNQVEKHKNITIWSRNGMNWYCWYLYYNKKLEFLNCDYDP